MQALAEKMAALENTKAAMVTSSGMSAISTTLLTLLKSGDHLLVQQSLYGGTEMFLANDISDWGITFTRVDADKPESWSAAVQANTKVLSLYHRTIPHFANHSEALRHLLVLTSVTPCHDSMQVSQSIVFMYIVPNPQITSYLLRLTPFASHLAWLELR